MTRALLGLAAACLLASSASAQERQGRSLKLDDLQRAAIDADPRTRELALQQTQTDLRLRNISVQRLPAVTVEGLAQYQSDVPTAPFTLPTGQPLFSPPKTTFDGHLRIDQRLLDPSVSVQAALERAQLDENQARVRTALYARRQMVNDAFFAAARSSQGPRSAPPRNGDAGPRRRGAAIGRRDGRGHTAPASPGRSRSPRGPQSRARAAREDHGPGD